MKYQPLAQAKRRPFEEACLGSGFDLLGFVISTSEGALNDQVANPLRQSNDLYRFVLFLCTSWLLGSCGVTFCKLCEDKNDVEAQKIYDDHFPLYKPHV